MTQPVFAEAITQYFQAGWPAIIPVPVETKFPPPVGYTGESGSDTSAEILVEWATGGFAEYSVALRLPDGIIGIDVDHYASGQKQKVGADTLADCIEKWGPLPATWHSTARGTDTEAGPSRIMFFQVPPGRYRNSLTDIDIIQRHHRYAVVAPSPHLAAGAPYRWYRPDGGAAGPGEVPRPEDLPWLPATWEEGLREGASGVGVAAAGISAGWQMLSALLAESGDPCGELHSAAQHAASQVAKAESGSRHDVMAARVHQLVHMGAAGHAGVGQVLTALRQQWDGLTAGENRADEFENMLLTSARKSVTTSGALPVLADPCMAFGGYESYAPAGWTAVGSTAEGVQFGEYDQVNEVVDAAPSFEEVNGLGEVYDLRQHVKDGIGHGPFDPNEDTDQALADAVLARCVSVARYTSGKTGSWLIRGPLLWMPTEDLSKRLVAEVADLMPWGDATPVDKSAGPTHEQRQYKRRIRFLTNGPSSAIAAKIRDRVAGGQHPLTVELELLDSNPEILWAGGWAWDLRASAERPVLARVSRNVPHMHSCAVAPELVATPAWDRFVATVWPDPEIRAWALRVLSVSLAGYPDAVLPVLHGPERSGKTSLVSLLIELLGTYGIAADPRLLSGADNAHASIVFALKGARLAFIDEGPRRGHLASERLKQLTGGGKLTGNEMRMSPITFAPTHTLVMTTNDDPPITDPALRARMRVIPCEADKALVRAARQAISPAVWTQEAPGVLAAMMRETAAWLADRNSASSGAGPLVLRTAEDEMEAGQNPIVEWVEFCTVPAQPGTQARALYRAFAAWFEGQPVYRRQQPPSETAFGRKLTDLGYPVLEGQGPRKKLRYRPLSVMGGGPGGVLWDPTPITLQASTPAAGSPTPTVTWEKTPTASEKGRSSTVFSSSSDSADSKYTDTTTHNTSLLHMSKNSTTTDATGILGQTCGEPGVSAPINGLSPAVMPAGGAPLGNPRTTGGGPTAPDKSDIPDTDVATVDLPAGVSAGQPTSKKPARVSKLSDAEKAARAAERRAAKLVEREAARLLAVALAGGEMLALPVVVDREGHTLPCTVEQAALVVQAALSRSGALTVDVETSGYPVGHEHYELRTVQLGDSVAAVVLHPVEHAEPIRRLLAQAPRLHAHSATADLVPLAHAGLVEIESAWARMHDTVIPAKLADPQSTGSDPGLKQLAGVVLGAESVAPAAEAGRKALFAAGKWLTDTKIETPPERSGWAQVASECAVMARYAASDVLDTAELARRLPQPAPAVYERERTAQRLTARVTDVGIRLDGAHIAVKTAEHTAARAEAGGRAQAFGIANPGSDQQVAQTAAQLGAVLPLTKTGRPSVAAGVLEPYRTAQGQLGEFVGAVLDYRHAETVLGLFLEPYRLLVERGDGRARPTIYTLGTDTGRMSAVRPNIQQLSRQGGVRACITADPGQMMISADFSGVELRVAAALSGDLVLTKFIADGRDLHGEIAKQVWGPEATKSDRYVAKRIVFGRLYGGGIPTLAAQAGVSQSVAGSAVDVLDAMLPQLSEWSRQVREAVQRGATQFPTYSGRVIHLPREFPHKSPNYCIQGSARELLVDALIKWQDTRWGNSVMFPVHDEFVAMVPAEDAEVATTELVKCMETTMHGIKIASAPSDPSFAWADSS